MLKPAQLYVNEISDRMIETAYDPKYKYYHLGYTDAYEPSRSTWDKHEFASVDSAGKVIGYISYHLHRYSNLAYSLCAINFTDNKATFGMDLCTAISDIFMKYGIDKLEFCVVVGNPIEASYDRMIEKYGGVIVGTRRRSARLSDGNWCDMKLYDILRDDFIKASITNKRKQDEMKVPDECYRDFGADLDGCFRQESQGCKGCRMLIKK